MPIQIFNDGETIRQQRNLTNPQKKTNTATREGLLVNNFQESRDNNGCCKSLGDTYDALIISNSVKMPQKLDDDKSVGQKSLIPISAITVGVMASVAILSAFIRRSAKINMDSAISRADKLPSTTRNVAINEETHQAIYRMVKNPTPKTILAGCGVLALTAMAFVGKTFFDGYRDVWVKKKEAQIQKNLQEKLIDIETQSFSGKMQIIRSMLAEKGAEFSNYLDNGVLPQKESPFKGIMFGMMQSRTQQSSRHPELGSGSIPSKQKTNKNQDKFNLLLGIGTVASIVGLGFLAMRNLNAGKKHINKYIDKQKNILSEIISSSTDKTKATDKITMKAIFNEIDASPEFIDESLKKLNWSEDEITDFRHEALRTIGKVNEAMGGDGTDKTTFYSHVNDYRAHLFNYLLNTENKQFKQLFFGITGITALGYSGKLAGEAVKEVEVKKLNADTEIDLQQKLVSTELRNFKSKKDAAIKPLVEEFYSQVAQGKSKDELKVMANNILLEIKNGPPFVFS